MSDLAHPNGDDAIFALRFASETETIEHGTPNELRRCAGPEKHEHVLAVDER
jgi:hypothetical protein